MFLVLILVLTFGVAYADGGSPDFTKSYDNSKGTVTFNHTIHQNFDTCAMCHSMVSTLGNGEVNKKVGHGLCKACHKLLPGHNAPTTCTGCHKR